MTDIMNVKLKIVSEKIEGTGRLYRFSVKTVDTNMTVGTPFVQSGCIAPKELRDFVARRNTSALLDKVV